MTLCVKWYNVRTQKEVQDGSILRKVPIEEGDEESQSNYNEEQETRDFGDLPDLRNQDVQNRQI